MALAKVPDAFASAFDQAWLAGVAAGPVLEKRKEQDLALGWQTNLWVNYFAGLNLRWRRVNGQKTFAPGLYAKVPLLFGYEAEDDDTDWEDIFDV